MELRGRAAQTQRWIARTEFSEVHMRSFVLPVLLLLLLRSSPSVGQEIPKATLIERCDPYCQRFHGDMMETALTLRLLKSPAELAVLRVCSKQPMPLALATAAMRPREYADWIITRLGYSPEHVLFLRSEDCLASNPEVTVAELWAIPKDAVLPTHVESITSCQFRIKSLGTRARDTYEYEGAVNYMAALRRLIIELRDKPDAAAVIWGYYLERPTSLMRRRINKSQGLIQQSSLSKNRYQVRFEQWSGEVTVYPKPDPEPVYPTVYFAEVRKGCVEERVSLGAQSNKRLERTRQ